LTLTSLAPAASLLTCFARSPSSRCNRIGRPATDSSRGCCLRFRVRVQTLSAKGARATFSLGEVTTISYCSVSDTAGTYTTSCSTGNDLISESSRP
jgi:hypothetical protein